MSQSDFIIPVSSGGVNSTAATNQDSIAIAYITICALLFIVIVASFCVQFREAAAYGKFDSSAPPAANAESGGGSCRIPQRLAHMLSDFPPGVILFTVIFFTAATFDPSPSSAAANQERSSPSYMMLGLWLVHYIHRGLLHPLLMNYSAKDVEIGICLGGFFPNCLFATVIALHISTIRYSDEYFTDPRFIIGVVLFVVGFIGNRWSDFHLRSLRSGEAPADDALVQQRHDDGVLRKGKYALPTTGLFSLCYQPNYFCEFVEWVGFALLTSSLAGTLWALFGLSTFLPRSLAAKRWYIETFGEENASPKKAALIPFLI